MCSAWQPVRRSRFAPARWLVAPVPLLAKLSLPGWARISAISSCNEFTLRPLHVTDRHIGTNTVGEIAVRSRSGANGRRSYKAGAMTTWETVQCPKLYPSGADFETMSVPTTPPAPARFSTTHGCPSISLILGARMRIEMSVEPPGPKGTTKRMGLLGQGACARTTAGAAIAAAGDKRRKRRPIAADAVGMLRMTLPFIVPTGARRDGGQASRAPGSRFRRPAETTACRGTA